MPRIGLIQTRGIGDILIALPIADAFMEQGYQVSWPIDARFLAMFRQVKPEVDFLPVEHRVGYYFDLPLAMLTAAKCERIVCLYSFLTEKKVNVDFLHHSLKFDEYKYAVSQVAFSRKWDLKIKRDLDREKSLHAKLKIDRPYLCVHDRGSDLQIPINIPPAWREQFQIVTISELSDNPFDWIYTLEHAAKLILVDSVFSNLVEQLNLPVEKYLLLRSNGAMTPVYKNGWIFLGAGHPMVGSPKKLVS